MKNRLYEYEADTQRMQQENALENEKVNWSQLYMFEWLTDKILLGTGAGKDVSCCLYAL